MRVTTLFLLVVPVSACGSSTFAPRGKPDTGAEAGMVDSGTGRETAPDSANLAADSPVDRAAADREFADLPQVPETGPATPDVANDAPVDQAGADRELPDLWQRPETAVPDVVNDRDGDRPPTDLAPSSDLPPDSLPCLGFPAVFVPPPRDEASCVKASCVAPCDPGPPPVATVTAAPGGPLLAGVQVTGLCSGGQCSSSSPSGCSQIQVRTLILGVGTTCDLVAVSTDGRKQSFRITVVQVGPASSMCCGYPAPPYPGLWTTSSNVGFDPSQVVVDFNRDGGVPDGARDGETREAD
jgi:hypothetical protein